MGARILFVDDEQAIVRVVNKMLAAMGYTATCVNDSVEALDTFRANPHEFDIVITDMTMPKLNGTALTNEILKIKPETKVLVITGFSDIHNPGAKMRIEKPISSKSLHHAIETVLNMD